MKKLMVSKLPKTWLIDIDGVVFKHNNYLKSGGDVLNDNIKELFRQIPANDIIVFLTSRSEKYRKKTIAALSKNDLRFNHIIFDLPKGERIVINDIKPKGLKTAISINTKRDLFEKIQVVCDDRL